MKPKELISTIDKEINTMIKEEWKDIEDIVDSYDLDEKYRKPITDYMTNVIDIFSEKCDNLVRDTNINCGKIYHQSNYIAVGIGGMIGGGIGIYFNNNIFLTALLGGMIAFGIEFITAPISQYMIKRVVDEEIKNCETTRNIYRDKTILKLEKIYLDS
ncbi:hypothetical protein ACFL1H_06105 [Nanoarchaeota archaeon]